MAVAHSPILLKRALRIRDDGLRLLVRGELYSPMDCLISELLDQGELLFQCRKTKAVFGEPAAYGIQAPSGVRGIPNHILKHRMEQGILHNRHGSPSHTL